jgi:hypothetical protein
MIDWTFALLFRPDTVKISLDREAALVLREPASGCAVAESLDQEEARNGVGTGSNQTATWPNAVPRGSRSGTPR